jgi:hypothetical protein
MGKKHLAMILTALLMLPLFGCGLENLLPGKEVPPLDSYSTVALVSVGADQPSEKYTDLPVMLSYGIGTKLELRREDATWIYDKSQGVTPVSDKIKELNITANDVFGDPETAAKLAEALQADLVITWKLTEEPRYTKEESGRITEDRTKVGRMGAARYYTVHQTALLKAEAKIVTKTGDMIWDGKTIGYKKYETRYLTEAPPVFQREETMYSDLRKDFVQQFVDKVYPMRAASES